MATSVRLIRRYVWLVDTIRRAGNISLDDINDRWLIVGKVGDELAKKLKIK